MHLDRYFKQFRTTGRVIDKDYLAFVRSLPCLACDRSPCDPDHLKTRAQGRNDYLTIPLCREHHTERGQIGNNAFERIYRVDLENALIAVMASYLEKNSESAEVTLKPHKRPDYGIGGV